MKKFYITEQERRQILSQHGLLMEAEEIKQGTPPDPYQYKKDGNKFWYAFKNEGNNPQWKQSLILKGVNAISQNIFGGGKIAETQVDLDKLYAQETQSNVTTTTTTIASGAGSGTSGAGSSGAGSAAGGGASSTTSQQKQYGQPIMDPKNINVGTTYVTFAKKDGVVDNSVNNSNGTPIYCKVDSVKDNVEINGRVYKLVKGTNTETNKPCGSLSFNSQDGWMALIDDKNIVDGLLSEPDKDDISSKGSYSFVVPATRSNEFSLFSMPSQVKGQPGQVTDKFGTRPDISGVQNTQQGQNVNKYNYPRPYLNQNTSQQPVQYGIKDIKDLLKQKGFRVGSDENKLGKMTLVAIEKALSKKQ